MTELVIDMHTHGTRLLPQPFRALHRRFLARSWPENTTYADLAETPVRAVVAKAVGDPLVTRWRRPWGPWHAVRRQFAEIRADASAAGCRMATTVAEIRASRETAVLLGIEGADVVGADPSRLDDLYALGVRVVGLVHYADNELGTICMSWDKSAASPAVRAGRREPGLTALGAEVVAELNRRGMVIDLAHADRETIMDVCARTTAPVISSHTGARAVQDFARYLGDDEIRAIAGTGGLIGLWPYGDKGIGVSTVDDFVRHVRHLAEVAGPAHLCFGTDMNGVSGLMSGYRGARDFAVLTEALRVAGLSEPEVAGVAGGNAARVLTKVCG
ncbi:membrane dipeptidase [Allokutzneria sp. A3M-2-11 16]|uniref:dipeptidase n=1 Tax=Allokutzneria sp. A3M-2-11 16 TaxID=2962043 RepID=UPI0020B66234|nr:membrane dipeptidase [Allokutzneria sp. A3M-2-11 16]MCP3802630.1 membrane dipeptidase [Allokutzneria sp. A3M-2-11 16]